MRGWSNETVENKGGEDKKQIDVKGIIRLEREQEKRSGMKSKIEIECILKRLVDSQTDRQHQSPHRGVTERQTNRQRAKRPISKRQRERQICRQTNNNKAHTETS